MNKRYGEYKDMFAVERQKIILDSLKEHGAVQVSKLSQELGVTEETVRRDLEKLEKNELLIRTHGGAIPLEQAKMELSLEKRKHTNTGIKENLAKEATKVIVPGDTIFLDASTTTFYMAKELKNMHNITVITNSIRVIQELSESPDIKVVSVGGFVSQNQSFVGNLAESNVTHYFFADKMFFSSRGITANGGILESNEQECAIKQRMLKNAKETYYLCDASKVGRIGFAKLCQLDAIDCIISESFTDEALEKAITEQEIKLIRI